MTNLYYFGIILIMIIIINLIPRGEDMKKIYFCRKNDFKTKKVIKKLQSEFPGIKAEPKGCVGKCKTCKGCPFLLLDGDVIKSDSNKKLFKKTSKKVKKTS